MKKRNKRLEILLTEEEMEKLEKIAKKLNIPKARLSRNLILIGLEDAELLNKIGAFDLIKIIEKMKEVAKELSIKNNTKIIQNN